MSTDTIVRETVAAKAAGFKGAKVKVGLPHVSDDVARLKAVRAAVGDGFEIMVDANQCFTLSEALRRAPRYAELGIAWFEEPLPADEGARLAIVHSLPDFAAQRWLAQLGIHGVVDDLFIIGRAISPAEMTAYRERRQYCPDTLTATVTP